MSKDAELLDWLSSMGVTQQFSKEDLQSGRTVASILKATSRDVKIQLQDGNSAITRVSNWNTIIQHLKPLNIKLTQDQKTKIINGNHDLVFKVISKLRQLHQKSSKQTQINLKDIDPKKDVRDAESLLELFLLAIIKHFNLSPKEALSLLSNDSKYLAHILAKGLKNDFRPIDNLVSEFIKQLDRIIAFSKNKQNEVFFLKSIKPALISKSQTVAQNSFQLILNYLEQYDKQTRSKVTKEYLTPTIMLIIRRHPQLTQNVVSALLQMCDYHPSMLTDMCEHTSKNELSLLYMALWRAYSQSGNKRILLDSLTFQNLSEQISNGLDDPDMVLNSLKVCVFMVIEDFDTFDRLFAQKLMMVIRQILLSKQVDNLELVHLYFCLIQKTGQQKHPLAPIIYKLLASRLPNAGDNEYQVLLCLFQQLFDDLPSIPPSPIIEALSQRPDIKVEQPEISLFAKVLSITTEGRVAVSIYNLVSRTFVEETGIGKQLAQILVKTIDTFKDEEILIDMTGKLIKVCLALYFANAKKMAERRKPLSHKAKPDTEETATKLKMLEIEYFLKRVIEIGIKDIHATAEPLVCFSYIQIAGLGKDMGRGLQKIVALLGDPGKLIAKYEKELNIDEGQKKSRIKHQSPGSPHSPSSPYPPDVQTPDQEGTSQNVSSYIGMEKKIGSPVNLHPLSLSLASVKPDAYLGLEKYAKKHQIKALAEQSKRYQAIQAAEQMAKQKKNYEKKIVLERGLKLRGVSETDLAYIFEFDSKQIYAESNQLYLNFYTPEAEQERDASGVDQAIRRYEKALKVYFKTYSGKKQGFHTRSFDEYQDRTNLVHSSAVYKLLKDHGMESYITPREIKTLARRINYKAKNSRDDPQLLDFEGFKEMTIQMSFTMFTRPPKDLRGRPVAEMLEQLFSMFKLYASENRINAQLFQQPEACYTGQEQAIRLLNKRLQQNPDYILPEGYKKITETRIIFDHKIFLQAMSPTYKQVYEVLDEIISEGLKIHIIEPFTQQVKICRARPNVYSLEYNKINDIESKHLPVHFKKEVAKFPMMERPIAKDAALALADIVRAIELNHDQVGVKHENAAMRHKRLIQEERQRVKEEHQQKRLNATRQLRSAIETFKVTRQEKLQKIKQEKDEESKKKKQKEQLRQKREREMKQKLEEYNQKKKEQQEARKANEKAKKQSERAEYERKKRQIEETKRMIDQKKKQKQQEEKERKQKEKQEEKRKRKQQRQRYEREQNQKKQKVQQYKKKKGTSKVIDAPQEENNEEQNP